MKMTTPEHWLVVKISAEAASQAEPLYKVFATWRGGYLGSDEWRINSGISKVSEDGDYFLFKGFSGSTYKCHKKGYGSSFYTQGVLEGWIKDSNEHFGEVSISILPKETDWLNLL